MKDLFMNAEQYLDKEIGESYQTFDETGITLITGIEHAEICRIMDEYHQYRLKTLGTLKCKHEHIESSDGCDECMDCRTRNF